MNDHHLQAPLQVFIIPWPPLQISIIENSQAYLFVNAITKNILQHSPKGLA